MLHNVHLRNPLFTVSELYLIAKLVPQKFRMGGDVVISTMWMNF